MKSININHVALATALLLSAVAEFYSIIGLTTIFSSAFWPIVILGGSLGLAKVVSVSWLYRNWDVVSKTLKYYLVSAVVVLMFITSMGTFGYLSKAHLDQAVPTGDALSKVSIVEDKIKIQKDNIDAARKAIKQMDEQVDQLLSRTSEGQGAERAVLVRRAQAKEREKLLLDIANAQKEITKLNEEKAPLASELRKITAEVGPIKYIAELIYGEADDSVIDKAVRWVIILIVAVFDPLAIALLIAANSQLKTPLPPQNKIEVEDDLKNKDNVIPRWLKRTHKLNEKRKAGKIEIDKKKIKVMPEDDIPDDAASISRRQKEAAGIVKPKSIDVGEY
jgi:hypothetical protein